MHCTPQITFTIAVILLIIFSFLISKVSKKNLSDVLAITLLVSITTVFALYCTPIGTHIVKQPERETKPIAYIGTRNGRSQDFISCKTIHKKKICKTEDGKSHNVDEYWKLFGVHR